MNGCAICVHAARASATLSGMERWQDQGIVLSARPHGEGGAVISVLTAAHGRHAGFVYGGSSRQRLRATLQQGQDVSIEWSARTEGQLGTFVVDDVAHTVPLWLDDPAALAALQSACALLDMALPEREPHAALYAVTQTLLSLLGSPRTVWGAVYVMWELAVLRELGFGLRLDHCVVTGVNDGLSHVSPKSGGAVCAEAAAPYADKLLVLPPFLRGISEAESLDVLNGLKLTGHFIETRLLAHTTHGLPESRIRLTQFFGE